MYGLGCKVIAVYPVKTAANVCAYVLASLCVYNPTRREDLDDEKYDDPLDRADDERFIEKPTKRSRFRHLSLPYRALGGSDIPLVPFAEQDFVFFLLVAPRSLVVTDDALIEAVTGKHVVPSDAPIRPHNPTIGRQSPPLQLYLVFRVEQRDADHSIASLGLALRGDSTRHKAIA